MDNCGILYLVATPIGNLEDITLRAIRILKEVDFILAEDTRHTLNLLNHLGITKHLISYYKETEYDKSDYIIEQLQGGKNIALVSDAGTPIISDPGEIVVKKAIEKNIKVYSIPGPCALISALISSGITAAEFSFFGFLPINNKKKIEKLEYIKTISNTCIFYEAPHKLISTLNTMLTVLGDRNVVVCKEITKIHESYFRGKLSEVINMLDTPKGEFVIIVEGNNTKKQDDLAFLNNLSLEEHFAYYQSKGMDKKEIIKKIAKDRNVNKNEIYKQFI